MCFCWQFIWFDNFIKAELRFYAHIEVDTILFQEY